MDFSIGDLMDETACYGQLLTDLHPMACPRCGAKDDPGVHRRHREPVLEYQCGRCGRVFNAWTDTPLQGTQRRPSQLILILRGFAQGVSTARLARELGCSRMKLLAFRHTRQGNALMASDRSPLPDAEVEADERYQNAGLFASSAPGSRPSASSRNRASSGSNRSRVATEPGPGRMRSTSGKRTPALISDQIVQGPTRIATWSSALPTRLGRSRGRSFAENSGERRISASPSQGKAKPARMSTWRPSVAAIVPIGPRSDRQSRA